MTDLTDPLACAQLAIRLLAMDPKGLGGCVIRARPGPVRSAMEQFVGSAFPEAPRLHPNMDDEALFGGLDVTATLTAGHPIVRDGLLKDCAISTLTMAERCPPALAARISLAMDDGLGLISWDEGAEPDDTVALAITDRCAFSLSLDSCRLVGALPEFSAGTFSHVSISPDKVTELVSVADQLGIQNPRVLLLAIRTAKCHAALSLRKTVEIEDLSVAAALTLAHRATQLPQTQTPENPAEQAPPPESEPSPALPAELILDAVQALLPEDLLSRLSSKSGQANKGTGAGDLKKGNRRGRPLPSRAGRLGGQSRIDLVATLRTAAPWQRLRGRDPRTNAPRILPSDVQLKRYESRSDRLLIFAVDASGSAAFSRLAEAKGAVELLLAQAYARRDHVALISFRGEAAELMLPPTRSLVQTKRRLAGLPGGGGTPLAAGLNEALKLAGQATSAGYSPTVVILTDGRANIALDGSADRTTAGEDARRIGRALTAAGHHSVIVDCGARPAMQLRSLAQAMDADYHPLPRADAHRLAQTLSDSIGA